MRRRIVYQWSFKRNKRDDRTINLMIEKAEDRRREDPAEAVLEGHRRHPGADQATIDRARQLAGLKGPRPAPGQEKMTGQALIGAYPTYGASSSHSG